MQRAVWFFYSAEIIFVDSMGTPMGSKLQTENVRQGIGDDHTQGLKTQMLTGAYNVGHILGASADYGEPQNTCLIHAHYLSCRNRAPILFFRRSWEFWFSYEIP